MDDSKNDPEARIRALGTLRFSPRANDEVAALTSMLEDPAVRSAAGRGLPRRKYRLLSRGHRMLVGGLIVLAGAGVAVPATALTAWLARTGEFGDPATSTEVDDTEWIDLGAPDAPQVVIDAYPSYLTLPDDVLQGAAIADVSRIFERMSADAGGQALAQEGLMIQTYEGFAMCAWTDEWLDAHESSDAARADRAATWLSDTKNYPALVANDGGGVIDAILGFASAAHEGDAETVEKFYDIQACGDRGLNGGKR
jgi:hypothetical protein